jgi:hypothetical protein
MKPHCLIRASQALGVALSLASAAAAAAATTCSVESRPLALVELYTSEGCNSCPPAERWLNGVDALGRQGLVPLALHVDYWDYIGWKDPFAQAKFTDRQRQLAKRSRANAVYTPGVFANGLEYRGWRGGDAPAAPAASWPATLTQAIDAGSRVATLTLRSADAGAQVFFAVTESNLTTHVKAGENKGETLTHNHVVREWHAATPKREAGAWVAAARISYSRPGTLVAFVEDRTGRVRTVAAAPLCGL